MPTHPQRVKWYAVRTAGAAFVGGMLAYCICAPSPSRLAYDEIKIGMDCRQACDLIYATQGQPHTNHRRDYRALRISVTTPDAEILLATDDYGKVTDKAYVNWVGRLQDVWFRLKVRLALLRRGFPK